jgi:hypothetical protein
MIFIGSYAVILISDLLSLAPDLWSLVSDF